MIKKNYPKILFLATFFLLITKVNAQNLYAGIEIGSKGLKVYVVDIKDAAKGLFEIKENWSTNLDLQRGIMYDGELLNRDIESTGKKIQNDYNKLTKELKVDISKISVVISSGVSIAKNVNELVLKVKSVTKNEPVVVNSIQESKLMFKGAVNLKNYKDSFAIDIGGGNTKGGFVEMDGAKINFKDFNIDIGTVALSEMMYKKSKTYKVDEFINSLNNYIPTLNEDFKKIFNSYPTISDKKKIYLTGGATWAFFTLFNGVGAKETISEFKFADVLTYNDFIQNNFSKFKTLALTDKEVDKVLNTYSQENLIAANAILLSTLQNISKVESKKLYFAKQPQTAWMITFMLDTANKTEIGKL